MTKKMTFRFFYFIVAIIFVSILIDVNFDLSFIITPFLFVALLFSPVILNIFWLFSPKNNGFTFWINPILKITAELVKIDGSVSGKEKDRVKSYLMSEFGTFTATRKFKYFNKYLLRKNKITEIISEINSDYETTEKIQVLDFLVGVALCDQYLSKEEKNFIENFTRNIRIHKLTLKSIYARHNYISEEYQNQKKTYTPTNYKIKRAYTMLGLDENASQEEIKKAYRELAKIYHPDKLIKKVFSKDTRARSKVRFQEINDAYNLLKN